MKIKQIKLHEDARSYMKNGIDILAESVKATLGPAGRNVVVEDEFGGLISTKDGVTVAKSIKLENPFENVGAQMVKEASIQTNESVGDGTTTSTVLAHAIISEGLKSLSVGVNAIELKRGIDKATKLIADDLKNQSIQITKNEEIINVGTISSNGDTEIGKYIAKAMDEVGRDGVIMIEDGSTEDSLEIVEGMQFERGYLSPYFINNNSTFQCIMENPYILLYDKKISSIKPLVKLLEQVVSENKPLLIIAEDIEGEALAVLVANKARGIMSVCAVKAPEFGDRRKEILEDLAVLTGGQVVSPEKGMSLDKINSSVFGTARTITIDNKKTTIIDGKGSEKDIIKRAEEIKTHIEKSTSDYEKEKLQSRLAKFSGGVAIIHIGAQSEIEMKDKKMRTEDALHATKAAVTDGILPGGGIALKNAEINILNKMNEISFSSEDEKIGFNILLRSLKSPFNMIIENSGKNGDAIWERILNQNHQEKDLRIINNNTKIGYDVKNGEIINMLESGIIDPTKVCITSLQKAASVAGMILTTESIICNKIDKNDKEINPDELF